MEVRVAEAGQGAICNCFVMVISWGLFMVAVY